jgi:GNAT superfamily N-acetyltransferase
MHIDDLFGNHLYFMACHRGSVRLQRNDFYVDGPTSELTSFVPGSIDARLPPDCPAIRLAPWSGGSAWDGPLERVGYQRAESLVYMELGNSHALIGNGATFRITLASDLVATAAFAGIQAESFATGDAVADDWWRSYFAEQAAENYRHPAQRFYLGWDTAHPVTTTLAIRTRGVTGIYAVATLPDHRRRGISAAVLDRARLDAVESGDSRLILQAMAGSYAESYYTRLGFMPRYTSQVWRR